MKINDTRMANPLPHQAREAASSPFGLAGLGKLEV
jgi:hypothetical protein